MLRVNPVKDKHQVQRGSRNNFSHLMLVDLSLPLDQCVWCHLHVLLKHQLGMDSSQPADDDPRPSPRQNIKLINVIRAQYSEEINLGQSSDLLVTNQQPLFLQFFKAFTWIILVLERFLVKGNSSHLKNSNTTLSPGFLGQRFNNLQRVALLTSSVQ